jgi:hypothetical protein
MTLLFSTDQFFGVFATYNQAIWPVPVIAYGLGIIAIGLVGTRVAYRVGLLGLTRGDDNGNEHPHAHKSPPQATSSMTAQSQVRGRILELVYYLQSVQAK